MLVRGAPIYLPVSRGDRALALSARHGDRDRLGSIRSQAQLGGLDVTVPALIQPGVNIIVGPMTGR